MLACLALVACKVKTPTTIPDFEGTLVLTERAVAGGAVNVQMSLTEPQTNLDFPQITLPGGNEALPEGADLHVSVAVNYTAAVQGGQKAGDFVPYLIAQATIQNLDSGDQITTLLVPEVSVAKGYSYGRNIALLKNLGASEAGYQINVLFLPPALAGDPSAVAPGASLLAQQRGTSGLSPGISVHQSLEPFLEGTLFSTRDITTRQIGSTLVSGAFTLADFNVVLEEGSEGGSSVDVPGYAY